MQLSIKKQIKKSQQGNFEEETTFLLKAAIVKLESERIDLEEKVDSMKEAEEKMTQWVEIIFFKIIITIGEKFIT